MEYSPRHIQAASHRPGNGLLPPNKSSPTFKGKYRGSKEQYLYYEIFFSFALMLIEYECQMILNVIHPNEKLKTRRRCFRVNAVWAEELNIDLLQRQSKP